ncbi:MAG: aspartate carbamoyltransferase regulatory subunit [Candidatus Methanomethyliaceae archaeon]|nr:aspartate carbamoyltransferase regulatory subunit [Candidatus Methanomethyliaceae archaeon]
MGVTRISKGTKNGLIVRPIKDGTVIDHIPPGKGIKIAEMLNLFRQDSVIIIGQNLESTKYGRKDIIKVENRFLRSDEYNKISLIAPNATINIIKDYTIQEKKRVTIPDVLEDVAVCINANCISNKEPVPSRLYAVSRDPLALVCHYCNFECKEDLIRLKT